ncbi:MULTISPECIES: hypothetical protein [unclassified Halomonas]|uniref:hypothetical protein n=1 Tax=unclassified Halomonas TaxID=2609666 RepID=UPI0020767376|nr:MULTISPECIES: hypothetical protein [unclassified Halomonas]
MPSSRKSCCDPSRSDISSCPFGQEHRFAPNLFQIAVLPGYFYPELTLDKRFQSVGVAVSDNTDKKHNRDKAQECNQGAGAAQHLGGVTGLFEMPKTAPLTLTPEDLQVKFDRARGRA